MTHENLCCKKIAGRNESERAAVLKLDAYIRKYERKFGKISLRVSSKKQLKLVKLIHDLMEAIEKEEVDKEQGMNS